MQTDPSDSRPYGPEPGGLRLVVRLTPRASRNGVDGIKADAEGRPVLQLRLVAPPVEGAANAALAAFLAAALGLRARDVAIRSGERSRTKRLFLAGDPVDIARRLESWMKGAGG